MAAQSLRTPSYRLHKPTGQAVVTLSGVDVYLGKYGSIESREAYDRAVAEWLASGRQPPRSDALTVNELIVRYLTWAMGYYRKNGKETSEVSNTRNAIRTLRKLYGSTLAADFTPLSLKAVREAYIEADLCRSEVNRRTAIVVRAFKWGVSECIVPPSVYHGLQSVTGLRRGRSAARETEPVKPVPEWVVEATLPFLAKPVAAMVRLMLLSGMRPGEACVIRACDLNMAGAVWEYRPSSHKTEHHERERAIFLGPRAQEIAKQWLKPDLEAYLFSPRDSVAEKSADKRSARKTKLWPSHVAHQAKKRKEAPKRSPRDRYDVAGLRRSIKYAVTAANKARGGQGLPPIPDWHPNQLRHTAATILRREFGLDVARCILGHSSPETTLVYAEADWAKAAEAMRRIG